MSDIKLKLSGVSEIFMLDHIEGKFILKEEYIAKYGEPEVTGTYTVSRVEAVTLDIIDKSKKET